MPSLTALAAVTRVLESTVSTSTTRETSFTGSGLSRMALTTVKMVVFAPMPSASERIATKLNAAFSFVAILSLALGIGANTTIFTVVNAILLNPLPVKDVSRVVEIDTVDTKTRVTAANAVKLGMSYMNFQDYARQTQLFSAMTCLVGPLPVTWSGGAEPRQLQGQMVSASYFDLLGLRPAAG